MNRLHMLNQHTVFEQLLTTLRAMDNLEDDNRNLSKKVEGNNNNIQQKQNQ